MEYLLLSEFISSNIRLSIALNLLHKIIKFQSQWINTEISTNLFKLHFWTDFTSSVLLNLFEGLISFSSIRLLPPMFLLV